MRGTTDNVPLLVAQKMSITKREPFEDAGKAYDLRCKMEDENELNRMQSVLTLVARYSDSGLNSDKKEVREHFELLDEAQTDEEANKDTE